MNVSLKKAHTIKSEFLQDWLISGLLCFFGLIFINLASNVNLWNQFIENQNAPSPQKPVKIARPLESDHQPTFPTPDTPRILYPADGTQLISSAQQEGEEISLVWSPLQKELEVEIELKRLDDPDFSATPELTRRRATFTLPDGTYSWRIRSQNKKGQKSEWTTPRSFSFHETLKNHRVLELETSQ